MSSQPNRLSRDLEAKKIELKNTHSLVKGCFKDTVELLHERFTSNNGCTVCNGLGVLFPFSVTGNGTTRSEYYIWCLSRQLGVCTEPGCTECTRKKSGCDPKRFVMKANIEYIVTSFQGYKILVRDLLKQEEKLKLEIKLLKETCKFI